MRWYFDFISPYAYLQSTRLEEFLQASQLTSQEEKQTIECVPILFAGLLNHWGNVGPAEVKPKRLWTFRNVLWTFRNVLWLAQRDNIPFKSPAQHPFNPLPLLRLSIVHNNEIEVVQRLFNYVWLEGNLPQDQEAFSTLLAEIDTKPGELCTSKVKDILHNNGKLAIERGVFGVPTVEHNKDIIWGYDATDMALAALSQTADYSAREFAGADGLPEGRERKLF